MASAVDAAVTATTDGDVETLEQLQAAAKATAPLSAEMEEVISALPQAAQLAARASAATSSGMEADGNGPAPSLSELLTAQAVNVDADDPELEDPREFFSNTAPPDLAQPAERKQQQQPRGAVDAQERVEWLGDWSS